jgi:Glycosyl hydrolases family 2, TIM barrel domain/Glycosyl hydrolases family 2/Glycosyl hydrolases family 2, sugar binding domain
MAIPRTKAASAAVAICVLLADILAFGPLAPGSAQPQTVSAQAPASAPWTAQGPNGRNRLARWTRRLDPANRGLARGWRKGKFGGESVTVPNVVAPRAYSGRAGHANYEGSVVWYRTTLHAPSAGAYALTFESANFYAQVWVDGHAIGSHRGSYLPFELRARLSAGAHTLVVRVDWRNPAAEEKLGYHRTWFDWGGLDGEVDVRAIGASTLSNPTIQTTLATGPVVCVRAPCPLLAERTATVEIGVEVRNESAEERPIVIEGTLSHEAQTIPLRFPEQRLAHGQAATVSATVTVPSPALWSPRSPSLYQLRLVVGQESSYSARVGLRQLTWHDGRMYLNEQPLTVHGATVQEDVLGHGDALTPGDERAIVGELKAIGANAMRTQHPLYPSLLERLDEAGILVWQGIGPVEGAGSWYSRSPALLAAAQRQARTAAIADQLHPSIFAWNLVDEVANQGHDRYEVAYVQRMARWLHAHDPGRMVAVDVWGDHPPLRPGALYAGVDAIAETDYSGWYDHPQHSPAAVSSEIKRRLAAMERAFAGRVLVISEFGAESNTLNRPGRPGSYSFQAALLARHIKAYAADPKLSGMFVYLLRDYALNPAFKGGSIHKELPRLRLIEGLNQKGLFTYAGRPKPAAATVGRLFKALSKA